jgi:tRNA A37 N6-isopentenylltransferase MiaA
MKKKYIVLTGATGVGKTAVIESVIKQFPFEVIGLDSCQAFTFFRIATGRGDSKNFLRYLTCFLEPYETMTPGSYVSKALSVIREIELKKKIPIFEGGSRSLLKALSEKIPLFIIGLKAVNNNYIINRLRKRVDGYFENGIIEETKAGLELGYQDTIVMKSPEVFPPIIDYLEGRISLEQAKQVMVKAMLDMHHAQMEFFSHMDIVWVEKAGNYLEYIIKIIRENVRL